MTDLAILQSIRDRVANAPGPDREIDAALCEVFGLYPVGTERSMTTDGASTAWAGNDTWWEALPLTSSIDAALGWVERVLPELHLYGISIVRGNPVSGDWYLYHQGHELRGFISGRTLPLALILAGLDALIAKEKTDETQ
jgi:hypothetical protein